MLVPGCTQESLSNLSCEGESTQSEMKIETRVKEDTAESRGSVNKVKVEVDALRNKLDIIRSDDRHWR